MKDSDGKRTFKLGLIVTHGIQMPKAKPTRSPPTRLPRSLYASQANSTATHPRPKRHPMVKGLILHTLPPFVELSQYNEPPVPGPSRSSKSQLPSHVDALTREP
ncbi:hypothetical protein O181_019694 [Austropuccinia psidii MF-1]|uniref:Uncharacterized protein n=1 Tax=Austropuccinia psidii MF-1 TaxID=1389203 RepID=A0A9Q3GUZ8_9BASI|nr:hypothetical protein [Austropuccinia psidii MF-1]